MTPIIRTSRATTGQAGQVPTYAPAVRHHWEWALVDVGLVLLLAVIPHSVADGYDGAVRFQALTELLERRPIAPNFYSLVGPLFSTPLYYLGRVAFDAAWWCGFYNTVLLATGLMAIVWLLRKHVDAGVLRTCCLLLVAASMFPNHVRVYFGEMFTAVLVLVGLAALSVGRDRLGWTAAIIGVVNSPATLVGMTLVAVRHVRRTRRLRHLAAVGAAVSLIMLERWLRRGSPFLSGYENNPRFAATVMPYSGGPGFNYPLFFGVLSILFSFGKGLMFFAPGLLLTLDKDDAAVSRAEHQLWGDSVWFTAGLILIYSKWWSWYGGWTWGPRFFLIASFPASLAIARKLQQARRLRTLALLALVLIVTMSVWVAVNGAVFDRANLNACTDNAWALELLCWYTPEFSVLWHPFIQSSPLSFDAGIFIVYGVIVWLYLSSPLIAELSRRARRSGGAIVHEELRGMGF